MKNKQMKIMSENDGFIAALDQSGGSTPKALLAYGVEASDYANEEEMFDKVHEMRTRIIKSPAFDKKRILGAILFEMTMDRKIDGKYTADYLWEEKNIVPFLKVDKGLADICCGVQVMKDMPCLDDTLKRANERNIYGTKMRSVIKEANEEGIKKVVDQQFDIGLRILEAGLVPIIEPEVDIHSKDKEKSEEILLIHLRKAMDRIPDGKKIIFKLSLPTKANLYKEFTEHEKVERVVALSGGYSREKSNELLEANNKVIASFSRALSEGLSVKQSDDEFNKMLGDSIESIYQASKK